MHGPLKNCLMEITAKSVAIFVHLFAQLILNINSALDDSFFWDQLWRGSDITRTQRRLQHVSVLLAGSDWLDVGGVDQSPEVVGAVAAVQTEAEPHAHQAHHRGDAGGGGVTRVPGLQLHSHLEVVSGRNTRLENKHYVLIYHELLFIIK